MKTNIELKDIDIEDIEDLLIKIENSSDIKFGDSELINIITFGQLCDHILNKIELENANDCTSQQAFYKLREAISSTLKIDKKNISTDLKLTDLFPRHSRRSLISNLETHLGFKINILRPPHWITITLFVFLIASFIGLFLNWLIGLSGLIFSISGLWLANKFGNVLDLQTVGEVAQKMTRENYLKSRRNSKTFNKTEIEKVLTDWFSNDLFIDKNRLTREAKFI